MSDQFDNKKSLSVFCTSKESLLTYADLLVYCYRVNQHAYETIPSHRRAAKATGLKEETVASATSRLHHNGLLLADGAVVAPPPRLNWFRQLDSLKEKFGDEHFSMWFQNWRCYVRQPGAENPMTVPCVMLYSLIRHSVRQGWKPSEGWSHEYLSLITGINAKTVSSSLERLEASGFITVREGMRFVLYKLRDCQLAFFADKRAWSGVGSVDPDEMVDGFSPVSQAIEEHAIAKAALVVMLNNNPISDHDKDRIYKGIISQDGWYRGEWQKAVIERVGKVMDLMDCKA